MSEAVGGERLLRQIAPTLLHIARRSSDRKRKETDRMAEFMQGALARVACVARSSRPGVENSYAHCRRRASRRVAAHYRAPQLCARALGRSIRVFQEQVSVPHCLSSPSCILSTPTRALRMLSNQHSRSIVRTITTGVCALSK
jgi:hypothetical protein